MIPQKSFFVFHTFLGFIFLLLGLLGLLAQFEIHYFIPFAVFDSLFLEVMILIIGIFFIREAVRNRHSQQRFVHFVVGLSLFFFAILPIFVQLGILQFLPYYIQLDISPFVLSLLLLCSGLYMIFDRIFLLLS